MPKKEPRFVRRLDNLEVRDSSWLELGQLRSLIALADERGWPDSSLISSGPGGEHPSQRDLRIVKTLVIEGSDPQS